MQVFSCLRAHHDYGSENPSSLGGGTDVEGRYRIAVEVRLPPIHELTIRA